MKWNNERLGVKELGEVQPAGEPRAAGAVRSGPVLRVVHVVLSMDVGGLERNVMNQVREAGRLNQEVMILCLEKRGELAERVAALGAKVVCMSKPPGLCWGLVGKVEGVLRVFGAQVVHSHQLATLLYGGRAARRAGVPVVVHTEHGREDYVGRWKTRWLGRLGGRYASRFYCLTEDMAREVRGNRIVKPSKVQVIHNGIDSTPFVTRHDTAGLREKLGIPAGAPVIGTVGRLTEIKRQDVLLRGFAAVRLRHPGAHLVLVGDGPLRRELEELAVSLGIGEVVHFVGYQAQTAPYLQMMDVFALTSRSEGLPQAAIEAGFAGVPVVASAVGGLPELVEDGRTGILFGSGKVNELAGALDELLRDRDKAARYAEQARMRVASRYEIRRMAEEYHGYYLERLGFCGA